MGSACSFQLASQLFSRNARRVSRYLASSTPPPGNPASNRPRCLQRDDAAAMQRHRYRQAREGIWQARSMRRGHQPHDGCHVIRTSSLTQQAAPDREFPGQRRGMKGQNALAPEKVGGLVKVDAVNLVLDKLVDALERLGAHRQPASEHVDHLQNTHTHTFAFSAPSASDNMDTTLEDELGVCRGRCIARKITKGAKRVQKGVNGVKRGQKGQNGQNEAKSTIPSSAGPAPMTRGAS